MTLPTADAAFEAERHRRARRTGVVVGLVALAILVGFMTAFTLNGLPKDPKMVERMRAAGQAAPVQESR
ncbi:MAG: hypothetical protein RLZZ127_1054 [Planctomycetota bacterium]|jgi:hypothetical protein